VNVPVKIYKRTTPTLTGFTNQQNYNGHSYYRSTGSATWTTARSNCSNMGGHLVTITTSGEQSFIFNLWPSGWIGLTDEVTEGTWKWVTGETYSYTNWNSGEPNNAGNEDYVQFVSGGRWNDLPNNVSLPYVLEFEYIVTYTAWVLHQTVYTNSSGYWNVNQSTNPATEWYIQVDAPQPQTLIQPTDLTALGNVIIGVTPIKSLHWNMYDVNNDGRVNIADKYYVSARRNGLFSSWISTPTSGIYTSIQYSTLNSSTNNLKSTYPGTNSYTINSPVSGGSLNLYIIAPGYAGQVNY
jgi:hypothetical protein